uniref:Peptidase C1A papain C-terminal domain-containing protein n=1 Tax=Meloidogyne javanica TaxID=6303 RepID=A0A915M7W4_MELJA
MSCTPGMWGCEGGDPYYAWKYTQNSGLVTGTNYTWNSGCKPYPFPPHGTTQYTAPSCVSSCTSSAWNVAYTQDKKYTKTTGYIQNNVAAIQNEIMANGSVVAAFDVYDDFMYYSSGQTSDVYVGGHAVRMIEFIGLAEFLG